MIAWPNMAILCTKTVQKEVVKLYNVGKPIITMEVYKHIFNLSNIVIWGFEIIIKTY